MPPDWDWIIDKLEDSPFGRFHIMVGLLAGLAVVAIGVAHLNHPEVLGRLHDSSKAGAMALVVIGATPAFLAALSFGQWFYPTSGGASPDRTGPLSGYLRQNHEIRKWKLRVTSATCGAANYLFLYFTAIHSFS